MHMCDDMWPKEYGTTMDGSPTTQIFEKSFVVTPCAKNSGLRGEDFGEEVAVDIGNILWQFVKHASDVIRSKSMRISQQCSPQLIVARHAAFDRFTQDGAYCEIVTLYHC